MKILITGAKGFIGKNLTAELRNQGYTDLFLFDQDTPKERLEDFAKQAEFVYHLAGVNRPETESEFMEGNFGFTSELLEMLKKVGNKAPIMISSSSQAALDNSYGKSKAAGEKLIFEYGISEDVPVYVYRFKNLYGKWSRPNYNTVVATFCYKISRGEEVTINDFSAKIELCYIDDVVRELLSLLKGKGHKNGLYYEVPEYDTVTVGELKELIEDFKEMKLNLQVPKLDNRFEKNLYSTYLSFLPTEDFSYPLKMNVDDRGSFTEIIRTKDRGQVSVNIIKPNIVKGNHWHHTKNEKFAVVSGVGVIRFRSMEQPDSEVIEYMVSGDKIEVVDIPVGYTHNIENLGNEDMVVVMWVNEPFDPERPDTYFEVV
ncbi:polysaccharide biosynthesis C-terminal domain-containing protein [Pilibacter termitis]|nr:NAD-dependent epimerase/dehydratase family protein [Pilibacter termitis]